MSDEYAVDTSRIYGTGQSMGCMTTLILASEYHMASFDYAYNCVAVMEWLFQQTK